MKMVKAIPDGYHSVTPYLVVNDAAAAIDFYKRAFDAEERRQYSWLPPAVIFEGISFPACHSIASDRAKIKI